MGVSVPASPKISVIIPTYGRRHILPRTIASVLAQDESDFELIVVDDCSPDDTQAYLASLTDPRIRTIVPARNGGTAAARNVGLEAARADVVALLDDDDEYLPRRLSAPLAIFAQEPDVVATVSSSIKLDKKGTQVMRMPELKLAPAAFEWALLCDLIGVEGTSITARRADAVAVGGFRSGMKWIDDREFLIRLARRGSGWLLTETLWQKHWSDDGQSNQWAEAGKSLLDYAAACPDLTARHRKVGSYFATKVLVADLRRGLFHAFRRDLAAFLRVGLIDGNVATMWRNHVEVRGYRRSMRNSAALAALTGPPPSLS